MIAQLLVVIALLVQGVPMPVGVIAFPMPDMTTCEAYMADPTPIVIRGAIVIQSTCVDEPTMPGKPA